MLMNETTEPIDRLTQTVRSCRRLNGEDGMGLLDFILNRTPARSAPPPPAVLAIDVTMDTGETEVTLDAVAPETGAKIPTDPLFLQIEYVDSAGNRSTRRVTIHSAEQKPGCYTLYAFCHEKRALRAFRSDRILQAITFDGEVFDGAGIVRDLLGLDDPPPITANPPRPAIRARAAAPTAERSLRRQVDLAIRPAVTLLVAAGRSDDEYHPTEVEAVHRYIEAEASILSASGLLSGTPSIEDLGPVCRRVKTSRPTREDLAEEIAKIRNWQPDRISRLHAAICDVIAADGETRLAEELFQSEMTQMVGRGA